MWVQPLGQEDPCKEEMATHSSIPVWRIPWTEESGGLQSMGVTTSQTWLSDWPPPCIQKMILEHVIHFGESNELSCIFGVFSLQRMHFYTLSTSQFGQAPFKDLAQRALHSVVTSKCLVTWKPFSVNILFLTEWHGFRALGHMKCFVTHICCCPQGPPAQVL